MPEQSKRPEEVFFETLTAHDLRVAQHRLLLLTTAGYVVLLLVIVLLVLQNASYNLRPVPVIESCAKEGSHALRTDTAAPIGSSALFARGFMDTFIKLYSERSPDAARNLAEAYNMMSPALQKILEAEKSDAGKAQEYFDKNVRSDFFMEHIKIEGDLGRPGNKATIVGTGKFFFRPAVGFDGNYNGDNSFWAFFQASVIVVPYTERTPHGLLIDYYKIDYFRDEELLKAFLLKARLSFEE